MSLLGGAWTLLKSVLAAAAGFFGGSVAWSAGTGIVAGLLEAAAVYPAGFSEASIAAAPVVGGLLAAYAFAVVSGVRS